VDTLVIEDGAAIPDRYHKVTIEIGWDDWAYLPDLVPAGAHASGWFEAA
jgi:hypothetical protein